MLPRKTLFSCFLRTYFIGSAFNPRGLQNIGLLFALEPALSSLCEDKKALLEARSRYMWHFNTHPLWAPLLVGMFINLEQNVKKELLPTQGFVSLKNTACYTLSAIGDSCFSGSLVPFWALSSILLLKVGIVPALLFSLALFLALQYFRLITFMAGVQHGIAVINKLKKFDIIRWGDRLKMLNGTLLAIILTSFFPFKPEMSWLFTIIFLGACFWKTFKRPSLGTALAVLFIILWSINPASLFNF